MALDTEHIVRYYRSMTPKQLELLKFIRNTIAHRGDGPTFKEMKGHMNVTSNQTIDDFLSALERDGYITINQGKQRGIMITDQVKMMYIEYKPSQPTGSPGSFTNFSRAVSTSSQIVVQNGNHANTLSGNSGRLKNWSENNGTT